MNYTRSIWRELKFIKLLFTTGIIDLITGFKQSFENLQVEKRRKRKLQMTSLLLS